MKWCYRFTMTGYLPFPVDMLRYDNCRPDSEEDSNAIAHSLQRDPDTSCVTLLRYGKTRADAENITLGRWQSFGWKLNAEWTERV